MSSLKKVINISIFHGVVKYLINAMMFFFGIYFYQIDLSGAQIGLIFAVGTITGLLTALPSGFSNDKMSSRNLMALGLILLALQYFGFNLSTEFWPTFGFFTLGSIGVKIYNTSADSLFYKTAEQEHLSKKIGIFQTINYIMIGLGMITAGFLLKLNIAFHQIFTLIGTSLIIMAILSQFTLPANETSSFSLGDYKKDLKNRRVLIFIFIFFLFSTHFGAEATSYGLFLEKNLHLAKEQIGLYMGLAVISMGLTSFLIAKNLKKWRVESVLLFGLFLSGSGHILMTLPQNPIASFFLRVYHETGDAAFFFFLYFGIAKLFAKERIGGNSSVLTLTAMLGSALGAQIYGPIGQTFGYNWPLVCSGTMTLIAFALTILNLKHFRHSEA